MRLLWICSGTEDKVREAFLESSPEMSVETAVGGLDGLNYIRNFSFDAVLTNFPIPGWSPEELLDEIQRLDQLLPVILRDPDGTLADACRLIKLGGYHYLGRDAAPGDLTRLLESAAEFRRSRELALFGSAVVAEEPWRGMLVGRSRAMEEVAQIIRLVGPRRCTVLVSGETGTGKEMAARALHAASGRDKLPMVAVNCSALPEHLLEGELFGHVKGAFTGAVNNRIGRFEQAHRSTLFLDEIGDLPLDLQAKLLRVLQEREFQRLGSSETVRVDVRVIAASNIDLVERIRRGSFREDLYYRLNVVPIHMPPLRERVNDLPHLVLHFIEKICRQEELPSKRISKEALDRLKRYSWPGNVRQLENAVEMAIALSGNRDTLYPADFRLPSHSSLRPAAAPAAAMFAVPDEGLDFEQTVGRIERQILEQALRKTGGNKKQAAEMLGLKRTTLAAKLRSLEAAACS